ncbi:dual specificity phosphatase, catalytic domain protein [Necator americanus]|uniref:protein-serine/threonine phosphatase n=1 Tax=Necator americanus TaxID=51031 RepID=W2TEJ7_NECAM|nr:dual specificity phosphatase, catalytic domain protein [Necator americanus]ETN80014.1 dual specificity phosphatase, catalytic domain protein [Necator americanus]
MSECYFAVRGAAVILPHSENSPTCSHGSANGAEIESHLQLMLRILRPQDKMSMAVRLQTQVADHVRYLAVVSTHDVDKLTLLIGMDYYKANMTIGVVLPLLWCSRVELAGDGGVAVYGSGSCSKADNALLFRPVSVQAMCYYQNWCQEIREMFYFQSPLLFRFVFQSLHKELDGTRRETRRLREPASATEYYMDRISSPDFLCAQWQQSPLELDDEDDLKADTVRDHLSEEGKAKETLLRRELRQIMQSVDLDSVTSRDIREALAQRVGCVDGHKDFIDREMLVILGQMDKPSRIFPYLLLGTEWNASNWEELNQNKCVHPYLNTLYKFFIYHCLFLIYSFNNLIKVLVPYFSVGYILNMTREVDNFFPMHFKYVKISVPDEASTNLLNNWNLTYSFIKEAKESGKVCLVHCKKGISRSSSTVIAYAMKEYGWSLEHALAYVKKRRNCITPNKGFMEQLQTFAGVLEASRHRHAPQFNGHGTVPTVSGARAHSASCIRAPRRVSSATDSVRFIIREFELRRRGAEDPVRHSFPLDVISKRSSIQQIS